LTPDTTTPNRIGRFLRFLRDDCPENPRVIVLWVASFALIVSLVATTRACSKWILYHGDLGSGACWAFGLSIGGLMTLAGFAVGMPKMFVPGTTKTTSESVVSPGVSAETSTTTVTDPVPLSEVKND
jgi:hypothetical protein